MTVRNEMPKQPFKTPEKKAATGAWSLGQEAQGKPEATSPSERSSLAAMILNPLVAKMWSKRCAFPGSAQDVPTHARRGLPAEGPLGRRAWQGEVQTGARWWRGGGARTERPAHNPLKKGQ